MPLIGSVSHLNALPLLEGLGKGKGNSLYLDTPVQLHHKVQSGKIEVALLPVVSYLEIQDLKLIPGTGIVSHGEVRSVKAFHKHRGTNLANAEKIYLDPHSKTSQKLLKILLVKKFDRKLSDITFTEGAKAADTVLEIGDSALTRTNHAHATDLGKEWQELTGLPFVYACWMTLKPVTRELLTQLHNAKMLGKQSLDKIAGRQTLIPQEDAHRYLTENIQYDIEGPELVGMKMFFDWVGELENENYDTSLRFVA